MDRRYVVENMKCNGCVTAVREALEKLPAGSGAEVDLGSATATVSAEVDPALVVETLTRLGYPARPLD